MINEDLNNNQTHDHNHTQRAKVSVQFMGQHEPIVGISYRFTPSTGEAIEGITDEQGYTKTLIGDVGLTGRESDLISYIQLENQSLAISLEVQKDDSTWKEIGNFHLEAGKEKEITAQIDTILLPFTLVPVKGQ